MGNVGPEDRNVPEAAGFKLSKTWYSSLKETNKPFF